MTALARRLVLPSRIDMSRDTSPCESVRGNGSHVQVLAQCELEPSPATSNPPNMAGGDASASSPAVSVALPNATEHGALIQKTSAPLTLGRDLLFTLLSNRLL